MNWPALFTILIGLFFSAKGEAQKLLFENTPLEEVIQTLQKFDYYLSAEGNAAKKLELNGVIDLSDPIKSINTLLSDTHFHIQSSDGKNLSLAEIKRNRIEGTIWDARSNEPFVQAHLKGRADQVVITDSDGKFQTDWIALYTDSVDLSTIGYKNKRLALADIVASDTLVLTLDINELETVVVQDYVASGISSGAAGFSKKISQDRLPAIAGNAIHDPLINIQQLPGIYSASGNAIDLNVRGGNSDQNLILWDQIPIYKLGHIFGEISSFNPLSTEQIQVFTGGYSSKYGGRVSSAILMDPLGDLVENELEVHADMLQYMAKAKLINKQKNLYGSLSYRHSFAPDWKSVTLEKYLEKVFQLTQIDQSEELAETGAVEVGEDVGFYDWQSKIVWKPWKRLQLSLSAFEAQQKYAYSNAFTIDRLRTNTELFNRSDGGRFEIAYDISDNWKVRLYALGSEFEDNGTFSSIGRQTNDQTVLVNTRNSVDQEITRLETVIRSENHRILFGIEQNKSQSYFEYVDNREEPDQPFDHELSRSTVLAEWAFRNSDWDISMGLRAITTTEDILPNENSNNFYFEPRLRLAHRIAPNVWGRASLGRYHQFISQLLLINRNPYAGVSGDAWFLSFSFRDLIPVIINNQTNLGIKWQNNKWLVDIEAYWKKMDDITSLGSITEFQTDIRLVSGESNAKGIDIMLRYGKPNFKTWLTYSYSDVDYFFGELRDEGFTGNHEVRHLMRSTTEIHYGDLSIGLSYMLRSGLPYTEPSGFRRTGDNGQTVQPELSKINGARLPAVQQFDLSLVYSWKQNGRERAKIGLDLRNLFDRQNIHRRDVRGYIPDQIDRVQTVNIERYYLRFTPNLFIKYFIL